MEHKFRKNSKYYTIGMYTLFFILLGTIIVRLVWNWDATASFIGRFLSVVQPFLLGLLIAYLINPLAKLISKKFLKKVLKIEKRKTRRWLSVLISYILVISAIVTVMFYIVPQIAESFTQLTGLVESAQNGYATIMDKLETLNNKHPQWKLDGVIEAIEDIPSMLIDFAKTTVPTLIPHIYNTSMSLISGMINLLISIMVSVYMLLDKPNLINNGKRIVYVLMKPERADKLLDTAKECNKIFGNFIIGKMIDSLIIGILCFIILTVVDMPYALVISVIVGVTNMIPYFGPFIGAIPGILLLLIVDFRYALLFGLIILALQQFDGLYLGPKILGESTGLKPLWIIFAITVGGWMAGVAGMFLGVPVVAVIAYLTDILLEKKLEKRKVVFAVNSDTGIIKREIPDSRGEDVQDAGNDDVQDTNKDDAQAPDMKQEEK